MLWSCMHLQGADIIACFSVMFESLVWDCKYFMLGQYSKCLLFYHNWSSFIKTLQVSGLPTKVSSGIVDIPHPPPSVANTKHLYLPGINSHNNPRETLKHLCDLASLYCSYHYSFVMES